MGIPMLFLLVLAVATMFTPPRVAELVINSAQIGCERNRSAVRVPWTDISHIGLMRGPKEKDMVVTARLYPHAPMPNMAGLSTEHRRLGYAGLCTLGEIGADRRGILEVLEPFAGPRLVRTSREFLHLDPRLNPNMV